MSDTVLVFEDAAGWRVLLGVAVTVAVLGLSWMGLRGSVTRWRRAWMIGLRGIGLVMLAVLFLRPALQERELSPIKRRLVLAVDATQSMELPAGDGGSRAEAVAGFIEREQKSLTELRQSFDLEYFHFDGKLHATSLEGLCGRTDGRRTDLVAVLAQLANRAGEDLAAVVLVSDGTDTAQLAGSAAHAVLPAAVETLIEAFPVPVNTFSVGARSSFVDLAVTRMTSDDFAFIRNAVEVEVSLGSTGLDEVVVPVVLEQSGRNLASATVRLGPGETRQVTLKFVPDRVGKFVYRISTPVLPGEALSANNTRTFVMRIIRDKIRVLHLVGRPSWDERFLRQVLKRNPNIDLVSFFILRTTTDSPGVGQDELSLIPFPVTELFGTELATFDVVIFQNFNHGPYQVTYFLPQLAEYVYGGGAFLMIGGDLSFGSGGYAATPLEDVLPVRLNDGTDLRIQEFRALPSAAGVGHPVMDLGQANIFERMPPLGLFNQAQSLQPGALVLLEHPFERSGPQRAPLLVLREVGRGRSAALLTDGAWRWNFVHAGAGGSPRTYHRLFNNLLRWLIQDPGLQAISLRADRAHYLPDEPVRLSARLHGRRAGAQVRLLLLDADRRRPIERRTVELDEGGRAELELGPLAPGAYLARIEATDGPGSLGSAEDAFVVAGASREHSLPVPRPEILERIAAGTGGRSSDVGRGSLAGLEIDERQRYRVEASTTRPLLGRFWMLAVLVLVLVAEWGLRRRWGFA